MSECRVYKRKPKRIKISTAEENEGTKEQQCCLVPGTPAKPSPGRLEANKVYGRRPRKKLEVKMVCESPSGGSFTMSPSNEKSTLFSRQGIDCDKPSASFDTMNLSDRKNFLFGCCMALTDKEKDQSSFEKTESIGVGSVGIIELNMSLDDPGLIYSNAGDENQQSCDPGLMDLNVSKEIEHSFDVIEGTCSGSGHGCLIDLNKSICSLESDDGSNEQVTQADEGDSTCLVSHAENQGLDIVDEGLNGRDWVLSYLLEPKAPQPYAMSENFPAYTEKLSSNLKLGQGQGLMQENVIRDRIHVEDDDCLRSKKPSRQKLKRKKHRPKVAIDVKTRTPKPATPKQAREKKPKRATPKQTKEKKTKLAAPKKAKGRRSDNVRKRRSSGSKEVMSVNELGTKNLSDFKCNPIVDINETKVPIARALDFQLESPNAKSVDSASRSLPNKKRRSKRRRKLNWFSFTVMTETKNVKNGKKKLFTVNWFQRKRRIHMNRPRKVAEVDAKINASIENDALFTDNPGLETHSNIVAEDNHGLVICDNTLVDDGLVGYKRDEIEVSALTERSIMREIETNSTSKASTGKKKRKGSTSDTSVKTKGRRGLLSKKFINFIINKLRSLHISDNILVPFKGPFNSIKKEKSSKVPKVILDRETVRVWNLLMGIEDDRIDRIENDGKEGEENDKMWEKEREVFSKRVATFIARMHQIQGDRGFKKWKGSILDSVIGVLLTQNVTDRYSSNAFLSLAAKFPPKKTSDINSKSTSQSNSHGEVTCSQESMGSNNMLAMNTKYDAEDNQYFISELEINKESSDLEINKELGKATNGFVDGLEETSVKQIDYALSVTKPKIWASRSISLSSLILDKAVPVYKTKMEHDNGVNFKRGRSKIPKAKEHDFSSMGFDKKRTKKSGNQELDIDWESVRLKYYTSSRSRDQMDSVDWEAVRLADVSELAYVILERGQQNELAKTIQNFLNRLMNLHNCLDLEWLRNTPPDLAQQYLLEAKGLGLKSVECIRLLALEQVAFPVDVNVARIVVRLGWVPLEELPEHLQIHLLELYPILDSIQIYLWPRLCTLPQRILYLLHFHMITFGKVTCTKINPNCKACPMKDICKHFKSKYASANKDLSYLSNKMKPSSAATLSSQAPTLSSLEAIPLLDSRCQTKICEPIIEEPFEPPAKLEILKSQQELEVDYDSDGIPIIKLNIKDFNSKVKENKVMFEDSEVSKAIVALSSKTVPARKLKENSRLRTEHLVYELPRKHILLQGLEQTESDEDVQYHLAIWRPGETPDSSEPPKKKCYSMEFELCNDETCFSCNNIREQNANIVRGTLLIPCRVANKGSFPLNGTYFQVNEVFADHETSYRPIIVPRNLIYNLRTRIAYFGSSISPMLRGESMENVQKCFWTGIVCTRGFERSQMAPRPLAKRFYCPASMREKVKRLTLPSVNVKKGNKKKSGKKKV